MVSIVLCCKLVWGYFYNKNIYGLQYNHEQWIAIFRWYIILQQWVCNFYWVNGRDSVQCIEWTMMLSAIECPISIKSNIIIIIGIVWLRISLFSIYTLMKTLQFIKYELYK